MGKLILVRHGHTCLNSPGKDERLRGWLDIPLDQQGLAEAAATAELLARYPVDLIYSSDLRRARQTAEVVRRRTRARHVIPTKDLRPWNLGVFHGQKVFEILPFLNLLNRYPDLAAPTGESFFQFYGRYSTRLLELMNKAAQSSGYVVAVTHVRNVLAARTVIEQGDPARVPVRGGPSTGTLTFVEKHDGVWKINNTNRLARAVPLPLESPVIAETGAA